MRLEIDSIVLIGKIDFKLEIEVDLSYGETVPIGGVRGMQI